MRVNTRLSRNTSLSMSPLGWLLVGLVLAVPLAAVLAVAVGLVLAGLILGSLAWLAIKTLTLVMWGVQRLRYHPAHK